MLNRRKLFKGRSREGSYDHDDTMGPLRSRQGSVMSEETQYHTANDDEFDPTHDYSYSSSRFNRHNHHQEHADDGDEQDAEDDENEERAYESFIERQRSKIIKQTEKKRWRDSRRFIFTLGALIGLIIPFYFGASHVHNNNKDLFDNLVNIESFKDYFDEWVDAVPQGLTSFITDVQNGFLSPSSLEDLSQNFAVGKKLISDMDIKLKHPVVMVPGVISTGVESWGVTGDEQCDSSPHFRKRLWGSFYMLRTMVLDKICWLKHLMLDPETGLDPEHFTLRAAQGFESTDYFMAGYWIWNKVIQNLGTLGYDPNTMITASYDWRLAYLDLERRDRYFTKLKRQIELFYDSTNEKAVLVGHSMGSQIVFYFLKWVEAEGPHYGNGGPGWVDKHIASFVNVAGTLLGVPKAVPALISGEMKDTIQLNALAMYGLEKFFSRKERVQLLQTWGGIPSMLPKGGALIWGNKTYSMEDSQHNNTDTYGNFIRFEDRQKRRNIDNNVTEKSHSPLHQNMTMLDAIDFVMKVSPKWLQERIKDQYTYDYAKTEEEMKGNEKHHSHWSNPLEVPLPNAADLKIYCIYGVHNPTERAYVYKEEKGNKSSLPYTIDYESEQPVFFTEGDGTVPLTTHAMCHKWAQGKSAYNPGGSEVVIVELKHQPDRFDIRGGARSAEHVDILGSAELNEYILKIAGGKGDSIVPRLVSNITEWLKEIEFPM
ncbi:phospholipid:diacylglycerol acyltransferase NDAI_0F01110 [Naumovozyma dairenensis CBS 421]|uniref:Phospholipid:diacylglycerol acyltransferase n=1 Tax=Naumovozyma dairenensis (strain ATCC 10597 / BCRC 20456 / CBS 421 / NBRC 0211 / NRRL Y-12639) TaxID=1071378 RepID=G0WCB9_NAUDC|nr:hypothetical protein NDAI_0F01110 [Naumovozyma dairenensis CBS 421]CCD25430.1 hypothetical protein NDAI_0F01110 [Naumovozyma dairenensis CBS 421]